jgi:hypothetical protein
MWPTQMVMKGFSDAKTDTPKAVSDANALFAKAKALSTDLAKYNLTLTVPAPVEMGAKKKTTD